MEYYLAMRKTEIWPFVAMWMELESVILSEISHTEIVFFKIMQNWAKSKCLPIGNLLNKL